MQIRVLKQKPHEVEGSVFIVPLHEKTQEPDELGSDNLKKEIKKLVATGQFKASLGDTYLIRTFGSIRPEAILLVGVGSKKEATRETYRRAGGQAGLFIKKLNVRSCVINWQGIEEPEAFVEGFLLSTYLYNEYKDTEHFRLNELLICGKDTRFIERKVSELQVINESVFWARDLINKPSNELGPEQLAEFALSLKDKRTKINIYDQKKIASFGMNAFLAVAKGSQRAPKFIVIEYNGGRKGPVALVGKSITFDSGGLSLKPSDAMEKMKYDMSGGAVVLAAIKAARQLQLPVKVIGALAATDNMPGAGATKPGDVVRAITGKTIEILNTDAEGRLTLADAIGFVKRFKPEAIVDIATLTGACVVTFGNEAAALMSNNDALAEALLIASSKTGERLWRMPLYEDYKEYIKSDVADLKNIGGRAGGLITAGYFLKEFADTTAWAHIDIASVAWSDKDRFYYTKGATAFGVRILIEFLKEYKRV